MYIQNLSGYRLPVSFTTGAPWYVLTLWFCLGAPLLSSQWLPGSGWRVFLLRSFGSRIGRGCRIKPGVRIKFPWRLVLGQDCWLGEDVWIDNLAVVDIGNRVCISQGVYLCTGNHDFRSPDFTLRLGSITVGSDAWIAAWAVIPPGCQIDEAAVVALGAVVSGSVPAGAIVRGNPSVVVGWR